eukprot:621614-Alexandrium_andersonii.AAC.1
MSPTPTSLRPPSVRGPTPGASSATSGGSARLAGGPRRVTSSPLCDEKRLSRAAACFPLLGTTPSSHPS